MTVRYLMQYEIFNLPVTCSYAYLCISETERIVLSLLLRMVEMGAIKIAVISYAGNRMCCELEYNYAIKKFSTYLESVALKISFSVSLEQFLSCLCIQML